MLSSDKKERSIEVLIACLFKTKTNIFFLMKDDKYFITFIHFTSKPLTFYMFRISITYNEKVNSTWWYF